MASHFEFRELKWMFLGPQSPTSHQYLSITWTIESNHQVLIRHSSIDSNCGNEPVFSELSTLNSLWKRNRFLNRFFYTTLFSNSFYHFREKFAKLQQAHPPTLLNSLLPGINWAISIYLGMNRFLKKKSCQLTILLNRFFNSQLLNRCHSNTNSN